MRWLQRVAAAAAVEIAAVRLIIRHQVVQVAATPVTYLATVAGLLAKVMTVRHHLATRQAVVVAVQVQQVRQAQRPLAVQAVLVLMRQRSAVKHPTQQNTLAVAAVLAQQAAQQVTAVVLAVVTPMAQTAQLTQVAVAAEAVTVQHQ
jgi:hypothetical protein